MKILEKQKQKIKNFLKKHHKNLAPIASFALVLSISGIGIWAIQQSDAANIQGNITYTSTLNKLPILEKNMRSSAPDRISLVQPRYGYYALVCYSGYRLNIDGSDCEPKYK